MATAVCLHWPGFSCVTLLPLPISQESIVWPPAQPAAQQAYDLGQAGGSTADDVPGPAFQDLAPTGVVGTPADTGQQPEHDPANSLSGPIKAAPQDAGGLANGRSQPAVQVAGSPGEPADITPASPVQSPDVRPGMCFYSPKAMDVVVNELRASTSPRHQGQGQGKGAQESGSSGRSVYQQAVTDLISAAPPPPVIPSPPVPPTPGDKGPSLDAAATQAVQVTQDARG